MSESPQDRMKREIAELLAQLSDDPQESLHNLEQMRALLRASAARLQASEGEQQPPTQHYQRWCDLLKKAGIENIPAAPRSAAHSDLLVFVPNILDSPKTLAVVVELMELDVRMEEESALDFGELDSICTHPGWVLIDETILGGRPITEEQKLLRMRPLDHQTHHVPPMDLASFLMYCAYCHATGQPLPEGEWTLAGSHWKESGRSVRVECTPPATVVLS